MYALRLMIGYHIGEWLGVHGEYGWHMPTMMEHAIRYAKCKNSQDSRQQWYHSSAIVAIPPRSTIRKANRHWHGRYHLPSMEGHSIRWNGNINHLTGLLTVRDFANIPWIINRPDLEPGFDILLHSPISTTIIGDHRLVIHNDWNHNPGKPDSLA